MTDSSTPPRRFTHLEEGTGEPEWLSAPQWDAVPSLDVSTLLEGRHLVVVAAHPDDETLSAGLLLAAASDRGAPITVLVATAGERSHPDSITWTSARLAAVRRDEVQRAIAVLAPNARLVHLDLPDSAVADHEDRLAAALAPLVNEDAVLAAPWSHDGHADHDAAGRVAQRCAKAVGAELLQYPIWLWHWGTPADLPWGRVAALEGTPSTLERKAAALTEHRSQVESLGPGPGDEPVVGPQVIARARRVVETFVLPDSAAVRRLARPTATTAGKDFDAMYEDGQDPWGFASSFYEARKRDLVLSMLRRSHYRSVLEVGCADGALSAVLAARSDRVVCLDVSAAALEQARARGLTNCVFVQGAAPEALDPLDPPNPPVEGPFDLVILSEVGYFMTPLAWLTTLRRSRAALAPGGEIVLVNWLGETQGIPLDGWTVHAQALAAVEAPALPVTASYRDAEVAVDVLGGPLTLVDGEAGS